MFLIVIMLMVVAAGNAVAFASHSYNLPVTALAEENQALP